MEAVRVTGTCGNCGGRVVVPLHWMCVLPPEERCESCGATVAKHGPVLPMNPPTNYGQHPTSYGGCDGLNPWRSA